MNSLIKVNAAYFREWCDSEMGVSARQGVALIAELVPYSSYLQSYMLETRILNLQGQDEQFIQNLSWTSAGSEIQHYLNLVVSLTRSIRKTVCILFIAYVVFLKLCVFSGNREIFQDSRGQYVYCLHELQQKCIRMSSKHN